MLIYLLRKIIALLTTIAILTIISCCALGAGLYGFVAWGVPLIFEIGTSSRLTYRDFSYSFSPPQVVYHDVYLRDRHEESRNEGVWVGDLLLSLDFSQLNRRRVIISQLHLRDSKIISNTDDTSFFRLMTFLFGDKPPRPGSDNIFRKYADTWKLVIGETRITAKQVDEELPALLIRHDDTIYTWWRPSVSFTYLKEDNGELEFGATASRFEISHGNEPALIFGSLDVGGYTLKDGFKFDKASLKVRDDISENLLANIRGVIITPGDGKYAMRFTSSAAARDLQSFSPLLDSYLHNYLTLTNPSFALTGRITGTLLNPRTRLSANVQSQTGVLPLGDNYCAWKTLPLDLTIDKDGVSSVIYNPAVRSQPVVSQPSGTQGGKIESISEQLREKLTAEQIASGAVGFISTSFNTESIPIEWRLALDIHRDSLDINPCPFVPAQAPSHLAEPQLAPTKYSDPLHSKLVPQMVSLYSAGDGNLLHKQVAGRAVLRTTSETSSLFSLDFALKEQELSLKLEEELESKNPQMATPDSKQSNNDESGNLPGANSQSVHLALDSVIDFSAKQLKVKELRFNQYPLLRLAERLALVQLLPPTPTDLITSGVLDGALSASGLLDNRSSWQADGTLNISDLASKLIPFESARAGVLLKDGKLSIPRLELDGGYGNVSSQLVLDLQQDTIKCTIDAETMAIGQYLTSLSNNGAALSLNDRRLANLGSLAGQLSMTIDGALKSPNYNAALNLTTIPYGLPDATASTLATFTLTGKDNKYEATLAAPETTSSLAVSGRNAGLWNILDGEARLVVNLLDFPLDWALSPNYAAERIIDLPQPLKSAITAKLDFQGTLRNPMAAIGSIELDRLLINSNGIVIQNTKPALINYKKRSFEFSELYLQSGDLKALGFQETSAEQVDLAKQITPLQLAGKLDLVTGWDTKIVGDWVIDHRLLPLPLLHDYTATLSLQAHVVGDLKNPAITGQLNMTNGRAILPMGNDSVQFDSVAAQVHFTGNRLELTKFTADGTNGRVELVGSIDNLLDQSTRSISLSLVTDNLYTQPLDNMLVEAQILLDYKQDSNHPTGAITGGIDIKHALYEDTLGAKRILSWVTQALQGNIALPTKAAISPRATSSDDTSGANPELKVKISNSGPVYIDTDIAVVQLATRLELLGTLRNPALQGEITTLSGSFGMSHGQFEIISGRLSFREQLAIANPQLDFLIESSLYLESGVEALAQILIRGFANNPVITVTSDSSMSDQQLLEAITAQKGEQFTLLTISPKHYSLQELLAFNSGASLADRLSGLAGFDEIVVDSTYSVKDRAVSPRVIGSKSLYDGLNLEIESHLGQESNNAARLNYPLSPRFSIVMQGQQKSARSNAESKVNLGAGIQYETTFSRLTDWWRGE